MTKITKISTTLSVLMLEKSYLHQNGVELNFFFIGLASRLAISLRINPRIRKDSKGVAGPHSRSTIGLSFPLFHASFVSNKTEIECQCRLMVGLLAGAWII